MGGDKKEESGFGFKDKQKALDTLRLLQEHDAHYRALTVRGLLGRARRVLTMTKAEEKVNNIKEAIGVFEEWLQQQKDAKMAEKGERDGGGGGEKRKREEDAGAREGRGEMEVDANEPKEEKDTRQKERQKADAVPGLGFKDAAAARATLRALQGRDPNYQKLAVKGLLGSVDRTLAATRDETKKKNIAEAKEILEKFLEDWAREGRGGANLDYLPLATVLSCQRLAVERGVACTDLQNQFVEAYGSVDGDYKRLRTVQSSDARTWDIVRNAALAELKAAVADAPLMADGQPTADHLRLALWAYSPSADKLNKLTGDRGKRASSPRALAHSKRSRPADK